MILIFKSIQKWLILITYAIVLYLVLSNLHRFSGVADYILTVSLPVVLGFAIAYTLNLPMKSIEKNIVAPILEDKSGKKNRSGSIRALSILLTLMLAGAIITGVVRFVLPQLITNIRLLTASVPEYLQQIYGFVLKQMEDFDFYQTVVSTLNKYWREILNWGTSSLDGMASQIMGVFGALASSLTTLLLSFIMAIYMLASKEKMEQVLRTLAKTYLPKKVYDKLFEMMTVANSCFSKYISGQFIEAFVIGIMCFVGMSLLRFPYAPLISVFVGATGLIPMFGAFIGAALGAFLILMESPLQALWFILFIIVLQQVEGNIVYPRVVGTSLGLKGIYVMLAIIIGGNLFGAVGMILGIPIFATVYVLIKRDVARRKGIRDLPDCPEQVQHDK